jgi:SOS-response transcriptional repressor LexA
MAVPVNVRTLLDRIDQRLATLGLSANAACEAAGLNRDLIRDLRRGRRKSPRVASLKSLADVLQTDVGWLIGDTDVQPLGLPGSSGGTAMPGPMIYPTTMHLPADVPVLGTAAASVAGAFVIDGPIDRVRRPPALAAARSIYALFVVGHSMWPRYRPGDLIFVSPDRHPSSGDDIIIQTKAHDGAPIEAWIKTLVRETSDVLIAKQLNPDASIEFRLNTIVAVHRVLSTRELFAL